MSRKAEENFTKEDLQMANKHTRKCCALSVVREIQIKITVRGYLSEELR